MKRVSAETNEISESRCATTVLVVEDEELVGEVTSEVLSQAGYRVFRASSAVEARGLFSKYGDEIDVLLSDTVLPDQNGELLAEALISQSPGLKVILCSGYPTALGRKVGPNCAAFLTKPYSGQAILSAIGTVVKSKAPARALALHAPCNGQLAKSALTSR